ncbi:unnamed protein product [Cyprideis torosa]|uniref:Uncharacterized protein n=1 Tax=Cyprideis torosa TaxID=163714 RepID=A0A7R8ZHY7_9CRUS|nr:unnamed protein product [Cyprideis torosa]CAG0884865.1 unnamed protein product [Cyprideis torosa]
MKKIKCQNPQLGFDGQHIMFSVMTWLLATVLLATHPVTTGGYILSGPEFEDNQHSVSVCPNTSVELTWSAPTVIEECKWTIFWFLRFSRLPMTCDLRIIGMQERVETLWAVEGRAWGSGVIYTSKKTRVWFMKPGDGPRVASGVQYSRRGNHLALQWYQSAVGECINGYILEYAPYDHGVSPRIPSLQGPQIVQRLLELQGQDQRTFKNIEHLHEEKKKIRQGLFDIVLQDLSTDDQNPPRGTHQATIPYGSDGVRFARERKGKMELLLQVVESTSSSPSTTSATTTSSPTEFCPRLCLTSIDGWCFEASSQIGVVYNPCPEDAYGKATHFCTPKGWLTSLPNLSNCTNPSLDPEKLVADLLHGEANATTTMDQVAEAVNLTKQIYAGDIPNVMQVVETVTSVLQQELQDNSTSISQAFDFANKLNDSKTAWATLGSNTDKVIKATEFQENVDSSICAIAHHLQPKTNKTIESESIVISMHRTPKLGLTEGDIRFRYAEYGRMVISNEALSSVAEMINVPDISIVFVGYDNLHCILQETVSDDCAAPQSTRIPFIREGSEILNMTTEQPIVDQQYVQVSKIIGAVIGCTDQHFVFSEKIPWPEVEFTLTNLDDYDERLVHDNNLQCVFWNTTSRTWDDGGCITKKISQREVRCVCNHLTNFAVLLDVSGNMQLTEEGSLVNNLFKALTILCSCFSLTALFIAFLIFAFVRGVKSERTPIHTNLCICLFLGQLLLLVGLGVTGTMPLCRTVAVLLHFLFLSAMGWMLMEGILVYVLIKEPNVTQWPLISTIFEKYDPRFDKRGTFSTTRTSLPNGNFLVNNTYRRASSMSPPATSSSGVLSEPSGITQTPQEQPGSVRATVSDSIEKSTAETTANEKRFPARAIVLLVVILCDKFFSKSIRIALVLFLRTELGYDRGWSVFIFHTWNAFSHFTPLLSIIFVDPTFGKIPTLMTSFLLNIVGGIIFAVGSTRLFSTTVTYSLVFFGLILIALGSGSNKVALPYFGLEQFDMPGDQQWRDMFLGLFFCTMNAAAILSAFFVPMLRARIDCFGESDCYFAAFTLPVVIECLGFLVFLSARTIYQDHSPKQYSAKSILSCLLNALSQWRTDVRQVPVHHWVERADSQVFGMKFVQDVRRFVVIAQDLVPIFLFWAFHEQLFSSFLLQGRRMFPMLGDYMIHPEQMTMIKPMTISIFAPMMGMVFFPLLRMKKMLLSNLECIAFGTIIAIISCYGADTLESEVRSSVQPPATGTDMASVFVVNSNTECTLKFWSTHCGYSIKTYLTPGDFIHIPGFLPQRSDCKLLAIAEIGTTYRQGKKCHAVQETIPQQVSGSVLRPNSIHFVWLGHANSTSDLGLVLVPEPFVTSFVLSGSCLIRVLLRVPPAAFHSKGFAHGDSKDIEVLFLLHRDDLSSKDAEKALKAARFGEPNEFVYISGFIELEAQTTYRVILKQGQLRVYVDDFTGSQSVIYHLVIEAYQTLRIKGNRSELSNPLQRTAPMKKQAYDWTFYVAADRPPGVNIMWQIEQIVILAISKAIIVPNGSEYAHRNTPKSLQAMMTTIWMIFIALGNLYAAILFILVEKANISAQVYTPLAISLYVSLIWQIYNMVVQEPIYVDKAVFEEMQKELLEDHVASPVGSADGMMFLGDQEDEERLKMKEGSLETE